MARTTRIYALAREIGVDYRTILDRCRTEGIDISSHMSSVPKGLESTIRKWFRDNANGETARRNVMQLKDLADQLNRERRRTDGKEIDAEALITLCKANDLGMLSPFTEIHSATEEKIRTFLDATSGVAEASQEHEAREAVEHSGGTSGEAEAARSENDSRPTVASREAWNDHAICLLGISKSGKTVFWASMIEHSLGRKAEETAAMLHGWRTDHPPVAKERNAARNICRALLAGHDTDRTDKSVYEAFSLTFKKRRDLFFTSTYEFRSHDVAGENISRWILEEEIPPHILDQLSSDAERAEGLVILIDPTQGSDAMNWQDHLWRILLDRLRLQSGRNCFTKPVVIAFTKADEPKVAKALGMPTDIERVEARSDPIKYAEVTTRQDIVVRRFAEKHIPKTWRAINRDEPQRFVRNAVVMAISSTGVPVAKGQPVDALNPWRITDPFMWVLQAVEPLRHRPPVSIIIRTGLLLLVAAILAAILGWGHWERYRELVEIETRARSALNEKHFGVARNEVSRANGVTSWLYDEATLAHLLRDIERQEALFALKALLEREDFQGSFDYLARGVPEHSRPEAIGIVVAALRDWKANNTPPLLFSGTWMHHDYSQATANAQIACSLCLDDTWALDWRLVSEARASLCRAASLLDHDSNMSGAAAALTATHRQALLIAEDSLKQKVLLELQYQARCLQQGLVSRMATSYGMSPSRSDELLRLAEHARAVRNESWCSASLDILYWEVRLSVYALLLDGRPREAVQLYEDSLASIHSMPSAKREELVSAAAACERASNMAFIPAGRYQLGDNVRTNSSPARTVSVSAFYIDVAEVSKRSFRAFLKASRYTPKEKGDWFLMDWRQSPLGPYDDELQHSVRYVNAADAIAFAKHYGCDLPTEDEWEVAAGSDRTNGRCREYPYGDTFSEKATAVDTTGHRASSSPFGCLDMAGGLWEWVRTDGASPYALKGGSGMDSSTLGNDRLRDTTRVCYRRDMSGAERRLQFGFRCVLRPTDLISRKD